MRRGKNRRAGQALTEFAILYAGVVLPLTFMTIFVAQALWVWHSVADFTRDGAHFAATHCATDGTNVIAYMQSHVPPMIDQAQFQSGTVAIQVQYFTIAADGTSTAFDANACGSCVPDAVSVSITGYEFSRMAAFFRTGGPVLPPFTTNLPMESGGFQDASGSCVAE